MVKEVPAGPTGVPILGTNPQYADDPLGFMMRCAREYGDFVRVQAFREELYLLTAPSGVERVLAGNDGNYRKPEFQREGLGHLLGRGLITSEGDLWRRQRDRLQPAFYRDRIGTYADTMVDRARDAAARLRDGQRVDLREEMGEYTLHVVSEALLGAGLAGMEREINEALQQVGERFRADEPQSYVPEGIPTPVSRSYDRGVERLERVLRELIRQRRTDGPSGTDVLSILLRARGEGMSDAQLRDELMTMLLAGHDTTALTLTYAFHLLATHPDVQARFHEEVDALDGDPTMDDLEALDLTERIVRETMRLYPPVYNMFRTPVEPDEVAGFHVPAGATISTPQWVVHRDPRWFDDPDEFRPDRWTTDRSRPTFAYYPFGGGRRRCIGSAFAMVEAQLSIATIGRRYAVTDPDDLDLAPQITLQPAHPVGVTVEAR